MILTVLYIESKEIRGAEGNKSMLSRPRAMESLIGVAQMLERSREPPRYQWTDICKLYNEEKCTFVLCQVEQPTIASPNYTMR